MPYDGLPECAANQCRSIVDTTIEESLARAYFRLNSIVAELMAAQAEYSPLTPADPTNYAYAIHRGVIDHADETERTAALFELRNEVVSALRDIRDVATCYRAPDKQMLFWLPPLLLEPFVPDEATASAEKGRHVR
jgi:hypothetical protein